MQKKKIITVIILIIASISIHCYFVYFLKKTEINSLLEDKTTDLEFKTELIIDSYNLVSKTIYNEIINKKSLLSLYAKAHSADSLGKERIRKQIYDTLLSTYRYLESMNIKQLHFHLPDNTSFLRFHRPKKWGDDLTNIRYSVKMANKQNKEFYGFEEGRIFNGFRYVFPMSYKGLHIGTVETSFSFNAFRTLLCNKSIDKTAFMVSKSVVDNKVFESENKNYVPALISNNFYNEKQYLHYDADSLYMYKDIDLLLASKCAEKIKKQENFSEYIAFNKTHYIVSFYAVSNVADKKVAYIISYSEEKHLSEILFRYTLILLSGIILIPILVLFIFHYFASNAKIVKQNTLLTKAKEQLVENNNKLHKTLKVKDKFFSIIAHDLLSPFAAIYSLSNLIVEASKNLENKTIHEYSFMIQVSAKNSSELLKNLVQWSRFQTDGITFKPKSLKITALVRDVVNIMCASLEEKKIDIDFPDQSNLTVIADDKMIETVLRNLISNAIKFTPQHGTISVTLTEKTNEVIVSIKDSGIGIPEEQKQSLFDFMETNSRKGTNNESGTGLGLVLCKDFIKAHNKRLWVESIEGKGATFSFSLDLQ